MLHKLKNRKSEGFTIIEVLIVLAIAGLILLIVFLAVPALQRNARNTAIKNDAAAVSGGIATSTSDNGGKLPTALSGTAGTITITNTASETIKVGGSTQVSVVTAAPTATAANIGQVFVWLKETCTPTASARAAAVYYLTETSGTPIVSCIDT